MRELLATLLFSIAIASVPFRDYCGHLRDSPTKTWPVKKPSENYTPQLLIILNRHGARVPGFSPENVSWDCRDMNSIELTDVRDDDSTIEPPTRTYRELNLENHQQLPGTCYSRQLTNLGFYQLEQLGIAIREAYKDTGLVDTDALKNGNIFVRWDERLRTKYSAHGMLNGLFPVADGETQMIDTWTMDYETETLVPNSNNCPIIKAYDSDLKKTDEYRKYEEKSKPYLEAAAKELNWNTNMEYLHDFATSAYCNGVELPSLFTEQFIQEVSDIQSDYNLMKTNYPSRTERSAASVGLLLKEIAQSIRKTSLLDNTNTVEIYSAHDSTITYILSAFGLYDGNWPPFASYLSFDVVTHNDNGQYFVRFTYNGEEKTLEGCEGVYCSLDTFVDLLSSTFPSQKQCPNANI